MLVGCAREVSGSQTTPTKSMICGRGPHCTWPMVSPPDDAVAAVSTRLVVWDTAHGLLRLAWALVQDAAEWCECVKRTCGLENSAPMKLSWWGAWFPKLATFSLMAAITVRDAGRGASIQFFVPV